MQPAAAILLALATLGAQQPHPKHAHTHDAASPGESAPPSPAEDAPTPRVEVTDDAVVISIGPLRIPAATPYHHHGHPDRSATLVWPATGWLQGYRIDLVDAAGEPLPREMPHHAGVVNPERRQLAYDAEERLFAVGRETTPVDLPDWMGLAMSEGQRLVVYYALVNPTAEAIDGATIRITTPWLAQGGAEAGRAHRRRYHPKLRHRSVRSAITEVRPLVVGAGPGVGGSGTFDLPVGRSSRSAEFTLEVSGKLRAAGGHLHDYATEVRIEDAETGRVLVRLRAHTSPRGVLERVDQSYFLLSPGGLALEAGRRYRVTAVYDNPTGSPIADGAMAYVAGPFIVDG